MARRAYAESSSTIRTSRGVEYEAFARITHRLKSAAERGKPGFRALAEAIHVNRKLWNILATDVASDDNQLSPELRARILYLSEFTRTYSSKILNEQMPVQPLIEVNTAIMRGLRNGKATK